MEHNLVLAIANILSGTDSLRIETKENKNCTIFSVQVADGKLWATLENDPKGTAFRPVERFCWNLAGTDVYLGEPDKNHPTTD